MNLFQVFAYFSLTWLTKITKTKMKQIIKLYMKKKKLKQQNYYNFNWNENEN